MGEVLGVRFHGPRDLRLDEIDLPTPGPGEVRIRPRAVGICGTDAKIVEGHFRAVPGTVLGHEIAGHIDAVGAGVTAALEGDLVSVEPHLYCGACRYCRLGLEHLCPDKRAFGVHLDGGMAEAIVVPARLAYAVPRGIPASVACLAEPLGCAVHGIDRLEPRSGLPAVIIGAGPAGLMLTALAGRSGLDPIVVLEPDEARRTAALAFGADVVIDAASPDWQESAIAASGGHGFDFAIEAAGSAVGLERAIALSARRGRILVYGVAAPSDTASVRPQDVYARELTILGSALNPFTHARAVALLGRLPLALLDPGVYALAAYREAFDAQAKRRHLKVVIDPGVPEAG
jgi:L-iditol 2-dehydrogenase